MQSRASSCKERTSKLAVDQEGQTGEVTHFGSDRRRLGGGGGGDSRSGTVGAFPPCLGCTSGANDTEMIFLVSQLVAPVRLILVS